jgi:hypothetical protein
MTAKTRDSMIGTYPQMARWLQNHEIRSTRGKTTLSKHAPEFPGEPARVCDDNISLPASGPTQEP